MNPFTISALVAALAAGGFFGLHWTQQSAQTDNETTTADDAAVAAMAIPLSSDYVSTRPGVDALPKQSLSQDELDGLMLMREEEKMARDVYTTLYEQWQLPIFANIAQSEQTHTEAVRDLLEKYNLTDPVTDDSVGVFVNQTLAQMYTDLTEEGETSMVAALTVGAKIEDIDINDLQRLIDGTDNADIKLVYENLQRGSRNHLRSFVAQLTAQGVTYTPVAISQVMYDEIIGSARETGPLDGTVGAGGGMQQNNGSGRSQRGWGNRW